MDREIESTPKLVFLHGVVMAIINKRLGANSFLLNSTQNTSAITIVEEVTKIIGGGINSPPTNGWQYLGTDFDVSVEKHAELFKYRAVAWFRGVTSSGQYKFLGLCAVNDDTLSMFCCSTYDRSMKTTLIPSYDSFQIL